MAILTNNSKTPPTFLVHAGDDKVAPVANGIKFYESLNRNDVYAGMHIYSKRNYSFGITPRLKDGFEDGILYGSVQILNDKVISNV